MEYDRPPDTVGIYDGHCLAEGDGASDIIIGDWQLDHEKMHGPIAPEQMKEFDSSSAEIVAGLCWAMRRSTRRFRAASRFGPCMRFKGGKVRPKFRRTPSRPGGKARNGFYVGDALVSVDDVPEDEPDCWPKGGTRKGGKSRVKCFKCGKPGRFASDCASVQELCFSCGRFGHRAAQCHHSSGSHLVPSVSPSNESCPYMVRPEESPREDDAVPQCPFREWRGVPSRQ